MPAGWLRALSAGVGVILQRCDGPVAAAQGLDRLDGRRGAGATTDGSLTFEAAAAIVLADLKLQRRTYTT